MTIREELAKLEPSGVVRVVELDAQVVGAGTLRFHGYKNTPAIIWQGQQYDPWPLDFEGFARTSEQQPRPKVRVGNVGGSITTLCQFFDDLVGSRITRKSTLVRFLDAANFDDGNPTADPTQEMTPEVWYVERKTTETPEVVEFELVSPLELQNAKWPRRQIIPNVCPWLVIGGYRGPYCGYTGPPVAKIDDTPTSDPALDQCGGRLRSCKLRFGENNELPFGGFPAARLIR